MEFLVVLLVLAVFLGPSAYRLYERYKRRKGGGGVPEEKGPSYLRRLLRMLGPVYVLLVFFALLAVAMHLWLGR